MLIETVTSFMNLLQSINNDALVKRACKRDVEVLTSEKYRENVALQEKDKQERIKYPIVVLYDENIDYDVSRFYNDNVQGEPYKEINHKDEEVWFRNIRYPLMPYNLNYRVEIVCKQRIQLDAILLWVMQNIPDRGCLDVPYKDENEKDCIYESLLKRGNIIKADEGTSSVLYRRTFEVRLTTLLDGAIKEKVAIAEHVVVHEVEKGDLQNG